MGEARVFETLEGQIVVECEEGVSTQQFNDPHIKYAVIEFGAIEAFAEQFIGWGDLVNDACAVYESDLDREDYEAKQAGVEI